MTSFPSKNPYDLVKLFDLRLHYLLTEVLLPLESNDSQSVSWDILKMAYDSYFYATVDDFKDVKNCTSDSELFSRYVDSATLYTEKGELRVSLNPDFFIDIKVKFLTIDYDLIKKHRQPALNMFMMKVIVRDVAQCIALPDNIVDVFKKLKLPSCFMTNRQRLGIEFLTSIQLYTLHLLLTRHDSDFLLTAPNSSGASSALAMVAVIYCFLQKLKNPSKKYRPSFAPQIIIVTASPSKMDFVANLTAAHAVDSGIVVEYPDINNSTIREIVARCCQRNPDVFICHYETLNMLVLTKKISLRNVSMLLIDEADNIFNPRFGTGPQKAIELIKSFAPSTSIRVLSCLYAYDTVKPAMFTALRPRVLEVRSIVNEQRMA